MWNYLQNEAIITLMRALILQLNSVSWRQDSFTFLKFSLRILCIFSLKFFKRQASAFGAVTLKSLKLSPARYIFFNDDFNLFVSWCPTQITFLFDLAETSTRVICVPPPTLTFLPHFFSQEPQGNVHSFFTYKQLCKVG